MTTLSVPLTPELAKFIEEATKSSGLTKSDIMRQALTLYAEEQAITAVLRAEQEVSVGKLLRGTPRRILLK
jgi:Arc/MetJ-type ribon-helix-helix transcriptional regulator